MKNELLEYLLVNVSLLVLVAAVLIELGPLRQLLKKQNKSLSEQLCLGLIFGALSVSSTYTGLGLQGAVVNTRVISTLAAGLVGGTIPGLCAGLLGGIHRIFYDPSSFTSLACGIGTFCFGLIGAAACHRLPRKKHRNLILAALVVLAELLQSALILLISKPFSAAVDLEKVILFPKIVVNSLGLVLFMGLLGRLNRSVAIELAEQQYLALFIAQKCLPFLREGMENRTAMQKAVDTVQEILTEFQVALTSLEQVVAVSGMWLDDAPLLPPARRAIEEGKLVVERGGCETCGPDWAVIAAPLAWRGEIMGTLILCVPQGPNLILEADCRIAEGLAQMFSSMLELGEFQLQIQLRQQAELRALQSQIDPHFLFNALSTISALCSTSPKRAQETILTLASYFRQSLTVNEPFVTLEQELSNVRNYLYITEARFEGAIHVVWELPDALPMLYLPPLILQPIVENAIRHGKTAVEERHVEIAIHQADRRVDIRIADQGHGFPPEIIERLHNPNDAGYSGLFNVQKRLRSVYGSQYVLSVDSSEQGSAVSLSLPLTPPGGLRPRPERSESYAYRSR